MVEFAVGQDGVREVSDAEVVFLGPAFLEADDLGWGLEEGETAADFFEALVAEFGDLF